MRKKSQKKTKSKPLSIKEKKKQTHKNSIDLKPKNQSGYFPGISNQKKTLEVFQKNSKENISTRRKITFHEKIAKIYPKL